VLLPFSSSSRFFFEIDRPLIIFGEAIILTGEDGFSACSLNYFLSLKNPLAQGSFSCKIAIRE
jgi:hypothetical protein